MGRPGAQWGVTLFDGRPLHTSEKLGQLIERQAATEDKIEKVLERQAATEDKVGEMLELMKTLHRSQLAPEPETEPEP